jgi:hypothetical protein
MDRGREGEIDPSCLPVFLKKKNSIFASALSCQLECYQGLGELHVDLILGLASSITTRLMKKAPASQPKCLPLANHASS